MVDGIGQALAGSMVIMIIMAVLCVIVLFNVVLVALKLAGVLLLSWWYIAFMTPIAVVTVFVLSALIVGFMALLGKF